MRIFLIIRALGPIAFLLMLSGGCNQDGTPSKPPATVVKRISEEGAPSVPKKAEGKAEVKSEKKATGRTDGQAKVPDSGGSKEDQALAQKIDYTYDPRNRPDPFVPFFKPDREKEGAWECEGIPPGPLTDKEVAQFTLVAVVNRSGESVAMVQDPEGKGYTIRVGSYLGMRCGKVTSIGPEGVIVEEPYKDVLGNKLIRTVSLKLKASEGGGQ